MKNCVFALKLMWGACPSYIVNSILFNTIGALVRTLTSVWFVPKIVSMISQGVALQKIILFIVAFGAFVFLFDAISNWYIKCVDLYTRA